MQAPSDRPRASLRAAFVEDHRRLSSLVERLLEAFEANDRAAMTELWTTLEAGLLAHMDVEEARLLPRLEASAPFAARALFVEHQRIRTELAALGVAVDLHSVRLDTARAFCDMLRSHAKKEEEVLYSWAEHLLDADERSELLDALHLP